MLKAWKGWNYLMFGMCFQKTSGVGGRDTFILVTGVREIYTKRFHATEFSYNVFGWLLLPLVCTCNCCLSTLSVSVRFYKRKLLYLNIFEWILNEDDAF